MAKSFWGQNKKSNIPPIITGDNIENIILDDKSKAPAFKDFF